MRRAAAILLAVLFTVLHGAVVAKERPPAAPAYRVIVHPNNAAASVETKFLTAAFLKKITRWPGGEVIRPVDQDAKAAARRSFSEEVLGRSVAAVKSYWQQVIFSGRGVPPPELASDRDVVEYVHKHPGAVGYVSGAAAIGNARVVSLR